MRIQFIEFLSTLTLMSVVDMNLFEFRTVNCSLGTNCDVVADSVTNLSLVGSMVIDVCMTCERDLVLPASCDKSFLADRTI